MLKGPSCSLAAALACVLFQIMGAPHGVFEYKRCCLPVIFGRGGSSKSLKLPFLKGQCPVQSLSFGRLCVALGVGPLTVSLGDSDHLASSFLELAATRWRFEDRVPLYTECVWLSFHGGASSRDLASIQAHRPRPSSRHSTSTTLRLLLTVPILPLPLQSLTYSIPRSHYFRSKNIAPYRRYVLSMIPLTRLATNTLFGVGITLHYLNLHTPTISRTQGSNSV